jgi:hypothetical protein
MYYVTHWIKYDSPQEKNIKINGLILLIGNIKKSLFRIHNNFENPF